MATRLFLVDEAPGAVSGFASYASLIAIQILAPLVFVASATNVVPSYGPVVCALLGTGRIIPLLLRAVGRFQHVQQFWDAPGLEGFPTWLLLSVDLTAAGVLATCAGFRNHQTPEESFFSFLQRVQHATNVAQRLVVWAMLAVLVLISVYPPVTCTEY